MDNIKTPLLGAGSNSSSGALREAVSDCKLQEQCFLSVGTGRSSGAYNKVQRKLVIACVLCFIFMLVEVVGGYLAKSVAIMSDAAHMLSDVSAFLVSIFAAWAATQPSSWHYSFGYHRAEILGALVSVLTIWAVTGALVYEAVQRTINPVRVDGKLMFIISVAGVCFNILIALALGVHGHLGHSHGPGGCSGHSHEHSNSGEHNHNHSHGHNHSHHSCGGSKHDLNGSKHDHEHSHVHEDEHSSGDENHHGHNHTHDHGGHGKGHGNCCSHNHSHSHSSDSSDARSEHGEANAAASDQQQAASSSSHQAAAQPSKPAAGAEECIVIDLPATSAAGQSCGLTGHAVSCRCTISRTGSHEIEVRYELPAAAMLCPPGTTPVAAAARQQGAADSHGHSCHGPSHGPHHSHGHSHDDDHAASINLRSAVLHVIGDLLQSVGVAIAGALIWYNQDDPRWYLADPICTFVFSVVVLLTTRSILRDIVHVLMERTPQNVDVPAVSQVMSGMEGIRDVHDLHIWNISTSTSPVLTAHVHIGPDADANVVLQKLEEYIRGIGIDHSTIQICNPVQGS